MKNFKYIIIIALFCLCLTNFSNAEKLYKYKEKDGTWHYSNIPPATDQPVKIRQVQVDSRKKRLNIQRRGIKNKPELYVFNEYYGPVELEITLEKDTNISSDPKLPAKFILKPFSELKLVTFWPSQSDKPWSYRYQYRFILGHPKAVHSPLKPYGLPFKSEKTFKISQAFYGKFSHTAAHSRHAVDIPMPEGTKICAARDGVIMDITNDFFTGGIDKAYGERANLIRILHDDGTMALYAHLKLESALYPLGTRVSKGQVIAESGNTGFSTGPHLHFVIQRNKGMKIISVPFEFEGDGGKGIKPFKNMLLKSKNIN